MYFVFDLYLQVKGDNVLQARTVNFRDTDIISR